MGSLVRAGSQGSSPTFGVGGWAIALHAARVEQQPPPADNRAVEAGTAADRLERLARLRNEERSLSARRRRLHDRIDFIRSGRSDPAGAEESLARLLEEERQVSQRRQQLHREIDELRSV